ncbi:2,3-bisphosphoglycerate-independent phosphoglycerate mutase [Patescibacteria group bacterium]|nr:2,3-bisphosphoglycerate-independent phosphoglycerate mutase [Patescibacteria group bacterium]
MEKNKKVLLIVLDGFGESKNIKGNAIKKAKTPYIDYLRKTYPVTLLKTHGNAVGLPNGSMGGSEVGHYTMGAGRIVWQSLERINRYIKDGDLFKNKVILKSLKNAQKSALHLVGMISDEGVHSHINHLFALLDLAKKKKISKVYIHCITDGRDVPEKSAEKYLKKINSHIKKNKVGEIATIVGRYYAMDRDKNWKRTKVAYDLLTEGKGMEAKNAIDGVKEAYKQGDTTDYYLRPIIINKEGLIKSDDSIIFFNYRTDRAKQLTASFVDHKKTLFPRKKVKTEFVCFGPYSSIANIAFPEVKIKNNLGEILSNKGKKQLRIAETEKYAHVTFFFNSQRKDPYPGEKQILIPSPKVPSYALKPKMSAAKVTSEAIKQINKQQFDFILMNYANADLVGHSGNLAATVKCVEFLDKCLKKVIPKALKNSYDILLTADHGNAEQMLYPDGSKCPAHSLNKVPCVFISSQKNKLKLKKNNNGLQDIAPTVLFLLDLNKPKIMTGDNLIINQ